MIQNGGEDGQDGAFGAMSDEKLNQSSASAEGQQLPRQCYLCERPIDDSNESLEHIIPSALGGKLRSKDLLCADCNPAMGRLIDAELCRCMAPIANLLDVHRDRGTHPAIVLERSSGEPLLREAGGRLSTRRTRVDASRDEKEVSYSIVARDRKGARQALQGLSRSHPTLDIEQALSTLEEKFEFIEERLSYETPASSEALRAIVKIAVSYYLHAGGSAVCVPEAIAFIRGKYPAFDVHCGWHHGGDPFCRPESSIMHALAVVGDPERRSLVAFVELLGMYRFVVRLTTSYAGPAIQQGYGYDLLSRNECSSAAGAIDIEGLVPCVEPNAQELEGRFAQVMAVANERGTRSLLGDVVRRAFEACLRDVPNATGADLQPYLWKELEPFFRWRLSRRSRG